MQASNFGGTFDQLFLSLFYEFFTEDGSLYHGAKSQKRPKTQIQGGPAQGGSGQCWVEQNVPIFLLKPIVYGTSI